MNDAELERAAARLGADAAARIDPERVAASVLGRLRTQQITAKWWQQPAALRIAAAVALVVSASVLYLERRDTVPVQIATREVAAPLEGLSQDEIQLVLDSLAAEAPASEQVATGLHSLDNEQLTELLQRMEG